MLYLLRLRKIRQMLSLTKASVATSTPVEYDDYSLHGAYYGDDD